MVPASSHKVPRVSWYSGSRLADTPFAYGAFTLSGRLSQNRSARLVGQFRGPKPRGARAPVWAPPISLAATLEITVVFSSSGYLDVSVRRVPPDRLWIHRAVAEVCSAGFPHSDISGSQDICSYPKLFAACHVFHRLLVPRHPPCALSSITNSLPGPGSPFRSHVHSVARVGNGSFLAFFHVCFSSDSAKPVSRFGSSDVLIKILSLISSFLPMQFSRYTVDNKNYLLSNGEYESRTRDLLLARQALSQLS